ncbi:divalent-cation tolerance protein CutA [Nocardia gipuzkoensis]|uniref:divalent-cation tolerance protein CutA n=1 Tax=Nocardia gipuzkoensis TaxID=2749991 RepID=UPI003EE0E554
MGDPSRAHAPVSITAGDAAWSAEFTRRLVADGLAACGNIVPGIRSIYRWEAQIHDDARAWFSAIIERADAEHPDETPQVLAVSVTNAHPGYRE